MLSRKQFREHWDTVDPKLAVQDGPLWEMERYSDHRPSRWFVSIRSQQWKTHHDKLQYWSWCRQHCAGQLLCYSSNPDTNQEWWGFTHRADIAWWMLKWA